MAFDERKLAAFLAVVDCGSLGRAASTVHMTQPTLSRLIQDMELQLGLPLFERHSKGMVLTAAGETFVPHARLLKFEMEQAVEAVDALRGLRRGTVRIGAVGAVTRVIVAPAVTQLLKENAALRVSYIESSDFELLEALTSRRIDLMIASDLQKNQEIIRIGECAFNDAYIVFSSAEHALARKSDVDIDDVVAQSWVMTKPGSTPRTLFEKAVRDAGRDLPSIAVETQTISAQISMVAQGHLLGWLPHPLIASELSTGVIRALSIPDLTIHRRFFVYRRNRGLLPQAARELLKHLVLAAA